MSLAHIVSQLTYEPYKGALWGLAHKVQLMSLCAHIKRPPLGEKGVNPSDSARLPECDSGCRWVMG
jgi:hypothetical protein